MVSPGAAVDVRQILRAAFGRWGACDLLFDETAGTLHVYCKPTIALALISCLAQGGRVAVGGDPGTVRGWLAQLGACNARARWELDLIRMNGGGPSGPELLQLAATLDRATPYRVQTDQLPEIAEPAVALAIGPGNSLVRCLDRRSPWYIASAGGVIDAAPALRRVGFDPERN